MELRYDMGGDPYVAFVGNGVIMDMIRRGDLDLVKFFRDIPSYGITVKMMAEYEEFMQLCGMRVDTFLEHGRRGLVRIATYNSAKNAALALMQGAKKKGH